ncbi:hypothetical protein K435DRAFT_3348 [Dendrothele bispora CBS 962.96]|uniref:Uncharacterized protein n=1 Tax=Dendrothele bispora (strain CBS 962.96) TaxID=1314807 RepID=A0A4S8MY59_DENBC|nr:hypothetical protein K435DRAFT_3348 [Dendrothele bispora CBS 962.96]
MSPVACCSVQCHTIAIRCSRSSRQGLMLVSYLGLVCIPSLGKSKITNPSSLTWRNGELRLVNTRDISPKTTSHTIYLHKRLTE